MSTDPAHLGNVLVRMGAVATDRLLSAMASQLDADADKRLGLILVKMGLITEGELDYALHVQATLRSGDAVDAALLLLEFQMARVAQSTDRQATLADQLAARWEAHA